MQFCLEEIVYLKKNFNKCRSCAYIKNYGQGHDLWKNNFNSSR